jgi:hypothetical protein
MSANKSFQTWVLRVARAGDNPRGDFLRDTRGILSRGGGWSDDTLESVFGFMGPRACPEAKREARRCWGEYERWRGAS